MIDVRVQGADFDPGRQIDRLGELGFIGVVGLTMHIGGEGLSEALVEHYAAMSRDQLTRIGEEAAERWELGGVILIHRFGRLNPGDRLLFAGAAAADPRGALEACGWLVDAVRKRAPFWRKDMFADGTSRWR